MWTKDHRVGGAQKSPDHGVGGHSSGVQMSANPFPKAVALCDPGQMIGCSQLRLAMKEPSLRSADTSKGESTRMCSQCPLGANLLDGSYVHTTEIMKP